MKISITILKIILSMVFLKSIWIDVKLPPIGRACPLPNIGQWLNVSIMHSNELVDDKDELGHHSNYTP
jgi:hypothetical protein